MLTDQELSALTLGQNYVRAVSLGENINLVYHTYRAYRGVDHRVFEGSDKNDVLKGKDWTAQFAAMKAWDLESNHQFLEPGRDAGDPNWYRDVLGGLEAAKLLPFVGATFMAPKNERAIYCSI